MAYFLRKERNEDVMVSYRRYQQYLREHEHEFPPGGFALGTAEWYQNANDHRCPHDGWLEAFTISETAGADKTRVTTMRTRLLGAYHDGYIEFFYPRVFKYTLLSSSSLLGLGRFGQGDWLYDEFRLSSEGHLIHEIEWAGSGEHEGSRWIIEATDVEFRWIADNASVN